MTPFQQPELAALVTLRFRPPRVTPTEMMSSVRSERLGRHLGKLEPAADAFVKKVDGFVSGDLGLKSVKESFAAAYGSFAQAARAAEREGLVTGVAAEAVRTIMSEVRRDFTLGMVRMNSSMQKLQGVDQTFVAEAKDKLEKLNAFWQQMNDVRDQRQRMAMTN